MLHCAIYDRRIQKQGGRIQLSFSPRTHILYIHMYIVVYSKVVYFTIYWYTHSYIHVGLTSCYRLLSISPVPKMRPDSSVGIATGYGLDDRGVGVRVPIGSRTFSSPRRPDRLWGTFSLLWNG
jgi:hypothetical protein